jgi:acyl carrier protein
MEECLQVVEMIMDDVGIYLEEFNPKYLISDVILDSLSAISFYIGVENAFMIEIPDEIYTEKLGDYTIEEFCKNVILPLKK